MLDAALTIVGPSGTTNTLTKMSESAKDGTAYTVSGGGQAFVRYKLPSFTTASSTARRVMQTKVVLPVSVTDSQGNTRTVYATGYAVVDIPQGLYIDSGLQEAKTVMGRLVSVFASLFGCTADGSNSATQAERVLNGEQ